MVVNDDVDEIQLISRHNHPNRSASSNCSVANNGDNFNTWDAYNAVQGQAFRIVFWIVLLFDDDDALLFLLDEAKV